MSSETPNATQGPLHNGNPRGNPHAAPRCGAHARTGNPCRQPAMPNGKCRLHGGRSTGPCTDAGRAALAAGHTRHGDYGAESRAFLAAIDALLQGAPARSRLTPPPPK
jgi:hypothetical protein